MSNKLKNVAVSQINYQMLKSLGGAGDSFNDVITQLLQHTPTKYKEMTESRKENGAD